MPIDLKTVETRAEELALKDVKYCQAFRRECDNTSELGGRNGCAQIFHIRVLSDYNVDACRDCQKNKGYITTYEPKPEGK